MTPIDKSVGLQSLGQLAANSPLVRLTVRYWWLALPAGLAFYSRWKRRPSHDMASIMEDLGAALGPVFPLVLLMEMMDGNKTPTGPLATGPVKDATFTLKPSDTATAEPQQAAEGFIPN